MGCNENDIHAMIFGGGFVGEGGVGTGTQDQWAQTHDGVDIEAERMLSTQPTQATTVYVDPDDEAPTGHVLMMDDAKKKGKSHRTSGFNNDEDKCLCETWLATSHDCINGAQQKGKVYCAKVVQDYHERKRQIMNLTFTNCRYPGPATNMGRAAGYNPDETLPFSCLRADANVHM
jgi:hypothetical protein